MTLITNVLDTSADDTVTAVRENAAVYLHGIDCYIDGSTTGYVQLFNAAEASDVTLGTTVPDMVVPVIGARDYNIGMSVNFPLGLQYAVTTTATGSTAISPVALLNILYE